MKKTITLAALVVSLAATAFSATLDDAVLSISDFDGSKTAFTTEDIEADYFSTTTMIGTNPRANMTFTLVFDSAKLGDILDSMTANTSADVITASWGAGTAWGLGFSQAGAIGGYWSDGIRAASGSLDSYVEADGNITISIVTDNSGTRLYMGNGGTTWLVQGGLKFSAEATSVTINSTFAPAIEQLYVFDSALSATDVASVFTATTEVTANKNIPEPATATLSLLALAGLAARRRRK